PTTPKPPAPTTPATGGGPQPSSGTGPAPTPATPSTSAPSSVPVILGAPPAPSTSDGAATPSEVDNSDGGPTGTLIGVGVSVGLGGAAWAFVVRRRRYQ